MLDMMKGYVQLAAGLGQMSRRKAMEVAHDLVEGLPVGGLRPGAGAEAVTAQVTAVADELLAIGRQNRRLITQLVRTETHAVLASLGVGAAEPGAGTAGGLDHELRALHQRVDDLERRLREHADGATGRSAPPSASRTAASRTSAGRRAATKTTAKRATAKKTATKKATAKKTAAKKSTTTRRTQSRDQEQGATS